MGRHNLKRFTGLGGFADVDALSSPHTQGSDAGYLYQPSRYYSLGRLRRMLQANGFKALQSTNHPKTPMHCSSTPGKRQ